MLLCSLPNVMEMPSHVAMLSANWQSQWQGCVCGVLPAVQGFPVWDSLKVIFTRDIFLPRLPWNHASTCIPAHANDGWNDASTHANDAIYGWDHTYAR